MDEVPNDNELDDDEIVRLRKRLLAALSVDGTDDEFWPAKAVVCIEGIEKETGDAAFLWFTWDRTNDEGLPTWTSLGLVEHMAEKLKKEVSDLDGES